MQAGESPLNLSDWGDDSLPTTHPFNPFLLSLLLPPCHPFTRMLLTYNAFTLQHGYISRLSGLLGRIWLQDEVSPADSKH